MNSMRMIHFRVLAISLIAGAATAPVALAFPAHSIPGVRSVDGGLLQRVAIGSGANAAITPCSTAIPAFQNDGLRSSYGGEGTQLSGAGLGPAAGITRYVVRNPFLAFNGAHVDAAPDSGWSVRVISVKGAACMR
ncbi:hypothetical protein [Rhodomicrobium lacus]|uniref:hypothetical protein n=1 Tax=Rhodomicrobium lacus TaxID=2498452 RepID=UPI000F8E53A9|nr:hypothetical protein [Rhodomicrobium lacus]